MDNTRGNALNFGASTERGIMRASTSGNASEPPRATVIVNKDRGNYDEVSWLHLFPSFPPFFFFFKYFRPSCYSWSRDRVTRKTVVESFGVRSANHVDESAHLSERCTRFLRQVVRVLA